MSCGKSFHLKYQIKEELVFAQKAAGLNSHASDIGKLGFVEMLQQELGTLFVVHRLDKATSGAMVFARNKSVAAELSRLFETHQVEKKYWLLTDRKSEQNEFIAKSLIEKNKDKFTSERQNQKPNAQTRFQKIKDLGSLTLWEATPLTGKTHQIRLHAQDHDIPILGDSEHGGSPYYRLCLQSQLLKFELQGQKYEFKAEEPEWAHHGVTEKSLIFDAIQKRNFLYDFKDTNSECWRWLHQESPRFRIDQFGAQLWVYWYDDSDPTDLDLAAFLEVSQRLAKPLLIRKMNNRGVDPNAKLTWTIGDYQDHWIATENSIRYNLHSDVGQSPGLFLDQRENRWWVRQNSKNLTVLNLFSYTGGFSVNAALGDASAVCTVDVSKKFNEWAQANFKINNLNLENKKYEFWAQDSLLFLKGNIKRQRKFDLIICDPPSFGRSKEGVFQIQKDLNELVELCLGGLNKNGRLLLSTNYEGWDLEGLKKKILSTKSKYRFEFQATPYQGFDFELPEERTLMKSVLLCLK